MTWLDWLILVFIVAYCGWLLFGRKKKKGCCGDCSQCGCCGRNK